MDIPTVSLAEYATLFAALFIGAISAGRIARLLTVDHMPLIADFRDWYQSHTSARWGLLMSCHYCAAVWVGFFLVLWAYFSDLHTLWWLFNGSLAVSYLAASYVSNDGDNSQV